MTTERFEPPIPDWKPSIAQPLQRIAERMSFYTDRGRDFVVFANGTCVVMPEDLPDEAAEAFAKNELQRLISFHPDMAPSPMKDGNILIRYGDWAATVVLKDITDANRNEIDANHERALTYGEVLMTPLGPNIFDEFGRNALFGRCFMFMDALAPEVAGIVRRSA